MLRFDLPLRTRWMPLARLCGFAAVLGLASAVWLAHQVRAELAEHALTLGRGLERAPRAPEGTTTLLLNGQQLSLNASVVDRPVERVVDDFVALCGRATGGVHDDIERAIAQGAALPASDEFGIFRSARGHVDATAACVARAGAGGMRALMDDLGRAISSGDFGLLGQFRYVYARPARSGAGTQVLSVWSHGSLKLEEAFPSRGDAAGRDLVQGARPPSSVRTITSSSAACTQGPSLNIICSSSS